MKLQRLLFNAALLIFSAIVLASLAYPASIREYSQEYNVLYNKAVVYNKIVFDVPSSGIAVYRIPSDAEAISVYVDKIKTECSTDDNNIYIMLDNSSLVEFNYISNSFLDKNTFVADFFAIEDIGKLSIRLVLPPKTTVSSKPNSVIPYPTEYSSDGQSIIILWERQMKKGDDIPVMARFEKDNTALIVLIIGAMVLTLILVLLYSRYKKDSIERMKEERKPNTEAIKKAVSEEETGDFFEKHLKEDEEQIVNVLKQREGSCEQGTLRVITGFSKATLSRLLQELEDRKVVIKEKKGKKNLILLRKTL